MSYIFIHAIGQDSTNWNETISYMSKANESVLCPNLFGLIEDKKATFENLYSAFVEYCKNISQPLNLCGLSLGGIIALNYTIDYPEKVKSLVLIGTQYKITKFLFTIQTVLFKISPKSVFEKMGLQKKDVLELAYSMKNLDFSDKLETILCSALVICGAKDNPNKKSAEHLAKNIKNAKIKIIENAGHMVNVENPKGLALELEAFYQ
ncbi:MAG: alpha/beta fold hydrolase [Defluviitaleaceae bacterium]|nr:alpha/beta fold hydrolase [Defluviitaleaceae bacterium]